MNFQTVSTAEKLPTSDGLTGGYLPGGSTPGPLVARALRFVDATLEAMLDELRDQGLADSTTIILSAKHGQSPTDPSDLARVDDGPIIDGLNAAWSARHGGNTALVAAATDDDIMQLWLSDRTQEAAEFAKHYLLTHSAAGNDISDTPITVSHSGLAKAYAGSEVAEFFGVSRSEPRHPDLLGIVQHGVVYTGGTSKIAEHGGADPQDRDVALVVAGAGVSHGVVRAQVETTQIAPTILSLLGFDASALRAVRIEGTHTLPLH
jgi:arylsulfatase A-like enzyme